MSYRKLLGVAALSLGLASIHESSFAQEQKNVYNQSSFSRYQRMKQNTKDAATTRTRVNSVFPGWTVATEKLSGVFNDIYGAPLTLAGNNTVEKAENCLSGELSRLGIVKSEWQRVSAQQASKADYVYYKQVVDGHNVVFATMNFRFTKEGKLMRIQARNYGSPNGTPSLAISADDAKKLAVKDLSGINITNSVVDATWEWFPVPHEGGYDLHPAWHFHITARAKGSVPLKLNGYVDAVTGDLLYRTNEVKETSFDITVKGMVYKNGTTMPATLEPLPDLGFTTTGSSTVHFTDTAGLYTDASLLLPLSTDIPLEGKWSTVIDSGGIGLTPTFTSLISVPGTVYTYPTTAPSSSRHVNAYYHVNRIHNFMKHYFTSFTGLDFSLPTNVDLTSGTCNAFYDGSSINFFEAGGGCSSFAELGDVVYHEYGHGISDKFYAATSGFSMENGALNEANSDIWGICLTHDPVLARNAFPASGGFIRRYDITPQVYPLDLEDASGGGWADPHKNGQIIAGCWWDVAVNTSADTMAKLFTDVYFDVPDGPDGTEGEVFQTILVDALMADDNNANLADGTPHYNEIVAAFAKHGIGLEKDVLILHDDLPIQPAGAPITVNANIFYSLATYFHDVTMYYRVNNTGTYTPVVMTSGTGGFSGVIPAQTAGSTVEYYFVIHDALNRPNQYLPIACNDAIPSEQRTLPFQFAVGVHSVLTNDFESTPTGWGVGGVTGDDASGGAWHRAVPTASTFFPAWPDQDHTPTGDKCLFNGSSSSFQGVQGGTSSVRTPSFDISGYSNPVIEYYRWYSNELSSNFKNDPWVVGIRDASVSTSTWQYVERTYQPDRTWRHRVFPVSAYLPSTTTQVQLRFFASDSVIAMGWEDDGQSLTVGGLDDFAIYDKIPSSVNDAQLLRSEVFPNPADNIINVKLTGTGSGTISLYDTWGRKISDQQFSAASASYEISTAGLADGVYYIYIQAEKSIQSKKVVVSHR